MITRFSLLLVLAVLAAGLAKAESNDALSEDLAGLMHAWAQIKYEAPEGERQDRFEALVEDASRLSARYPGRAEPRVWEAIVRASFAGSMGRFRSLLSALPEVKRARSLLLEAEALDPEVLDGSVYTTLGSLYYMVPGRPLGFGDKEKALRYLEKAIAISPDGIDSNFFLGDYWRVQGDVTEARRYLERALRAPDRPGRESADSGRRREIEAALSELPESRQSPRG